MSTVSLTARQSAEGQLTLAPIIHEIRIQNQVIFLDPPIEHARATWVRQLHEWLGGWSVTPLTDNISLSSLQAPCAG